MAEISGAIEGTIPTALCSDAILESDVNHRTDQRSSSEAPSCPSQSEFRFSRRRSAGNGLTLPTSSPIVFAAANPIHVGITEA